MNHKKSPVQFQIFTWFHRASASYACICCNLCTPLLNFVIIFNQACKQTFLHLSQNKYSSATLIINSFKRIELFQTYKNHLHFKVSLIIYHVWKKLKRVKKEKLHRICTLAAPAGTNALSDCSGVRKVSSSIC